MKKILSIAAMLVAAVTFTACSSDENDVLGGGNGTSNVDLPTAKVLINGFAASPTFTSALFPVEEAPSIVREYKTVNPKTEPGYMQSNDGKQNIFFYVRIDGNIPLVGTAYSSEYLPRTKGKKPMYNKLNMGYAETDASWRKNFQFDKYIYATDGVAVERILSEIPSFKNILDAEDYLSAAQKEATFGDILANADEYHIIWYAAKLQGGDAWHVDGILTKKSVKDVKDTSYGDEIYESNDGVKVNDKVVESEGEVEADIHVQEHESWKEIKTSLHIRDTANVRVTIPIGKDYVEDADDFAIRTYEMFVPGIEDETDVTVDGETYKIKVSVKYTTKNIVIDVTGVTPEIISKLEALSQDGLTIEVHNYIKEGMTDQEIWEAIKKAKVETFKPEELRTPLDTKLYGQVSTYVNKESKPIGSKEEKSHVAYYVDGAATEPAEN